jgi:formyl-CoA transferase
MQQPAPSELPALAGIRVLDLTHFESGTSCCETLAWLGADVIKVEPPGAGEQGRRATADREDADSWYFLMLNANKRSIQLDLRDENGKAVMRRLLKTADIVVENLAPGAIERLGFGYDDVRAINPRVVYGSIKGYRRGSPFEEYLSFDPIGQSVGGAVSVTGETGGRPVKPGPTYADTGAGLHLSIGLLAALHQRERTGTGQRVDVSMQDAIINCSRISYAEQLRTGVAAGRYGNRSPMPTHPSDLFPCAPEGPNDYCFIYTSRANNVQWEVLLDVIGRPELKSDPRFGSPAARRDSAEAVNDLVSAWTRQHDKHEVMRLLGSAGVPAGAVLDTVELSGDEFLRECGMFVEVDHPIRGRYVMPSWPVQMSESYVPVAAPPILGAHTQEVLASLDELEQRDVEVGL